MGLDLSLSGSIGAGGGFAYVVLALLLASSRGGSRTRLLLAGLLGGRGLATMAQSLTRPDQPAASAALEATILAVVPVTSVLAGIFSVALALGLARSTSRRALLATSVALAALLAIAVVAFSAGGITPAKGDPATMPPIVRTIYVVMLVSWGADAVTVLAMAMHWKAHASRFTPIAAAAVALIPIPTLTWGLTRSGPEALLGCFAVACVLGWAPPWRDGSGRVGLAMLLGLLSWSFVGEVARVLREFGSVWEAALAPFAVAAALAVAIAVLRGRAWDIEPPRFAARRGPLAAASLAVLLIVAQVAENFLDARYGLLTGGILAGALLFAASPIQRMIERVASPEAPRSSARPADGGAEGAYRAAVRASLSDGAMTPTKEDHLAEVAEHLGLGPREALRIRRQVEGEPSHAPSGGKGLE